MTRYAACAFAMLLLLGATDVGAQQRELRELVVEFEGAPESWREAFADAPVVAHVKLLDKTYRSIDDGLVIITEYTAEVLEYLKAGTAVTSTIQIYRLGGLKKEDGREIKYSTRGYPDFFLGEEYVLFLGWNSDVGAFSVMGPNYTFRLDRESNRVYTVGKGPLAMRQLRRPVPAFLAQLRSAHRP